MRSLVRQMVPLAARQEVLAMWRCWRDWRAGTTWSDGRLAEVDASFISRCELRQPVLGKEMLANKRANIVLACRKLNGTLLMPRQSWSFWRSLGRADARRGFREGRNLINSQLVRQSGGGICQVSGLIYHLALSTDLLILERHPHSLDIYREDQRFTPLGADATVAWGSKDLRLSNPHPHPLLLSLQLEGAELIGRIASPEPIPLPTVRFVRHPQGAGTVLVQTWVGPRRQSSTTYVQRHLSLAVDAGESRRVADGPGEPC